MATAHVSLRRRDGHFLDKDTSDQVARAFEAMGLSVVSASRIHLTVCAETQLWEAAFNTRLEPDPAGGFRPRGALALPDILLRNMSAIVFGGAHLDLCDWADPPPQVISDVFYENGLPLYRLKETFATQPPPKDRVLLPSDVVSILGINPVHQQSFSPNLSALLSLAGYPSEPYSCTGLGVHACLVDSGIDVSHPSLQSFADAGKILFPQCLALPGVTPEPGTDPVGHGTMCAAALLAAAPNCALSLFPLCEIPPAMANDATIGAQVLALNLGNLATAVNAAADTTPSVVSLSFAFSHTVLELDKWYLAAKKAGITGNIFALGAFPVPENVVQSLFDICLYAQQSGAMIFAASGNAFQLPLVEIVDTPYGPGPAKVPFAIVPAKAIPYPAAFPNVFSVGGAYPESLNEPFLQVAGTIPKWTMSSSAQSGQYALHDASGLLDKHSQIIGVESVKFPDLCGVVGSYGFYNDWICVPWGLSTPNVGLPVAGGAGGIVKGWRLGTGGTSFATPTIAGMAALLLEAFPGFPNNPAAWGNGGIEAAKDVFRDACMDVVGKASASGDIATKGFDIATGGGVLNAFWLLARATKLFWKWQLSRVDPRELFGRGQQEWGR